MSVPLLAIDNLNVTFRTRRGTVTAIDDVSFQLAKGETLGIVGESGSGKSVTAYTLLGILDRAGTVAGGTAVFGGMNLFKASDARRRDLRGREFSIIFQSPRTALNPIRSVGRQIEDVLHRHSTTPSHELRKRAIALLTQVRITRPEDRYHAYPFELSGGMCQRVMIAIAMACEPSLLIADEPTTGLDVTTQKATMDLLRELTRRKHMALILITHDLGLAAEYCDRIIVMRQGGIVEAAPTATLFGAPEHPYTRKLIKATPRPESRLEDLATRETDTSEPATVQNGPAARATVPVPPAPGGPPLLEVERLLKTYPMRASGGGFGSLFGKSDPTQEFRAVNAITFAIRAGESVGLVGESGCGKSTTSRMIARLIDPTAGAIRFKGEDISAVSARKFPRSENRSRIQLVFQDPTDSLNPRFTGFDAIAEPLRRLGDAKVATGTMRSQVEELATMVGLPIPLLGRFPHQLSGGQKARIGIARAIAPRPELLILDEPTSALDVSVQAVVLQLLERLRAELGITYLFVSHDLNVVRLLCDRVIVMRQGDILEDGPSEQLLSNPSDPYTRALIDSIPKPVPTGLAAQ